MKEKIKTDKKFKIEGFNNVGDTPAENLLVSTKKKIYKQEKRELEFELNKCLTTERCCYYNRC